VRGAANHLDCDSTSAGGMIMRPINTDLLAWALHKKYLKKATFCASGDPAQKVYSAQKVMINSQNVKISHQS
jgi:hypothetical protein